MSLKSQISKFEKLIYDNYCTDSRYLRSQLKYNFASHMLLINMLFFYVILALIGFLIASYLGSKRQIGFKMSLFVSITLTPVIGLIVTLFSRNSNKLASKESILDKILGLFLFVLGILFLYHAGPNYLTAHLASYTELIALTIPRVMPAIGFIGCGIYLLGKAKNSSYDNEMVQERSS